MGVDTIKSYGKEDIGKSSSFTRVKEIKEWEALESSSTIKVLFFKIHVPYIRLGSWATSLPLNAKTLPLAWGQGLELSPIFGFEDTLMNSVLAFHKWSRLLFLSDTAHSYDSSHNSGKQELGQVQEVVVFMEVEVPFLLITRNQEWTLEAFCDNKGNSSRGFDFKAMTFEQNFGEVDKEENWNEPPNHWTTNHESTKSPAVKHIPFTTTTKLA